MSTPTVDVPAVGRVKKQYVYVGGALVVGIVGYAYWQRSTSGPADVPAYTDADVTDEGVTDTPGGAAGASANSGGLSVDNSTTPDTDAEWVQQANEALGGAFDSAALATALGKYITHQPMSSAEADMVRAAIGMVGYPPGGRYPIDTATGSTPSTLTEPKNLRLMAHDSSSVTVAFDPVPGAGYYRAYRSGASTNVGGTDAGNHFIKISGLEPNKEYSIQIAADTTTNVPGPRSAPLKVKTAAVKLGKPSTPSVSAITRSGAHVSTRKVSGATRYGWYVNGIAHGSSDAPSYTLAGLRPNTSYRVSVAADNGTQSPGPQSGARTFKTRK